MTDRIHGITVFVPIYNEEAILENNVAALTEFLKNLCVPYEIILGSNGSTDRTPEIGTQLESLYPEVRFFHIADRGPGLAFAQAAAQAKYAFFVCQDADLSIDLNFIAQASEKLLTCDAVIGSKADTQTRSMLRIVASKMFIFFTNLLLNMPYHDYSIGAKAYRTESIRPLLGYVDRHTFYTQALVFRLQKSGKRIIEIPVHCDDRRNSRFNLVHEGYYRYSRLFRLWFKEILLSEKKKI